MLISVLVTKMFLLCYGSISVNNYGKPCSINKKEMCLKNILYNTAENN